MLSLSRAANPASYSSPSIPLRESAASIAPTLGRLVRSTRAAGSHRRERSIARALEEHRFHGDLQHRARRLAIDGEAFQQAGIGMNGGAATDPQGFAHAGQQEQQRHPEVMQDIPEAVDAVVAAPVRQQRCLPVMHADESRRVAARRCIESVRPGSGQHREWRCLDQALVKRMDMVGLFRNAGCDRRAIQRFEAFQAVDAMRRVQVVQGHAPWSAMGSDAAVPCRCLRGAPETQ
jgi:hypothetical protein